MCGIKKSKKLKKVGNNNFLQSKKERKFSKKTNNFSENRNY